MRLYRLDFTDPDLGNTVSWFGSKERAEAALHTKQRERADKDSRDIDHITPVDVPTRKTELLLWLNTHLDTDNG